MIGISTADWSAEEPDDYDKEDGTQLTFAIGDEFKEADITTIDDGDIEHEETFVVTLHDPEEGVIGILAKTVIIIKDANTPGRTIFFFICLTIFHFNFGVPINT